MEFAKRKFDRGLTFEVPRQSLMTAVNYKVFDDLLIGHFMKTTFNGKWSKPCLYPDFTPYIAKYGDNGGARTPAELERYFGEYRKRSPVDYLQFQLIDFLHRHLEQKAIDTFRSFAPIDSKAYKVTKNFIELSERLQHGSPFYEAIRVAIFRHHNLLSEPAIKLVAAHGGRSHSELRQRRSSACS